MPNDEHCLSSLPKNVERCFSVWYRGMRTLVSDLLNFQVYRQSQQVLFVKLEIVLHFGMNLMFHVILLKK